MSINAPVIRDWYRLPNADGSWHVCGIFENHPDHPGQTFVGQTGPLIAEGDGWCQTAGRVYALGQPRGIHPTPATPEQIAAVKRAFGR